MDNYTTSNGFIFDGFPRTLPQAEAFDKFLDTKNMSLDKIISLEVSEDELVARLLKRGLDSGRKDDQNPDVIRNRIKVYESQTSILKTYYMENLKDKFFTINGERRIDVITKDILDILLKD